MNEIDVWVKSVDGKRSFGRNIADAYSSHLLYTDYDMWINNKNALTGTFEYVRDIMLGSESRFEYFENRFLSKKVLTDPLKYLVKFRGMNEDIITVDFQNGDILIKALMLYEMAKSDLESDFVYCKYTESGYLPMVPDEQYIPVSIKQEMKSSEQMINPFRTTCRYHKVGATVKTVVDGSGTISGMCYGTRLSPTIFKNMGYPFAITEHNPKRHKAWTLRYTKDPKTVLSKLLEGSATNKEINVYVNNGNGTYYQLSEPKVDIKRFEF